MSLRDLFDLAPHGPDTLVGTGHPYPWGGLYGGHIVAQALRAASGTVEQPMSPHSLRAYFIRGGDNSEPVRYEVDRIRNGRTFSTRRVVARQTVGAILNLEASFQIPEQSATAAPMMIPDAIVPPSDLADDSWSPYFERRMLPAGAGGHVHRDGSGHVAAWFRLRDDFGADQLLHMCALAYLSDDLPTEAVIRAVPELLVAARQREETGVDGLFATSLDHTVWYHAPVDTSQWHLVEASCLHYGSARGISHGYVFSESGVHVATVAQEVLVRVKRN